MKTSREKILKALGDLVRGNRQNLNISQEELAHRSGLDRTYISGIERGTRNPSFTVIVSLALGLGISVSQLFKDIEVMLRNRK